MSIELEASPSNDPEDAKWNHWREESLLHVFHTLLHKVWEAKCAASEPRCNELFFYSHQQFMRRANIEREAQGMKRIEPLSPAAMRESLGPGYRGGEAW